ncbi:MAG: hybrid sensor histidine kinase/response regulator [Bacteroidetes bacterium GWF2_41_61]|nr:MAG: hybrid sensor histidine kinase/response regulator [Bacteroidetes bacterium GWE2_40_15]OFY29671.1 MAG: hybrid sensor histidine kinase/response regulator [Bacteroidetes bacterium GWF2_41_61]OFY89573.1 MAG: hybrid sensor histidine kinase/response regulator [Bacteroidetes bacterium RIFOXYA12_FULL_40_10]HBG24972.1 hybrid sensor histidine kinase/response regulator [Rikenellaceae bacterium]HBZ26706.1 hybrid sensor histidine kinase/response regulator [Rikenellaceae bacterium]
MDITNSDFTILIVDDVDANVLLLKLLISKAGYKTLTAYNGKEALDIIIKQNPDLILLDIMMPIMDGHEVARQLKEMPDKAEIPIIFLSALNSTEDIVQGFKLGAADYVSKPFNKDELLTRINHQISLIHAKRTISSQTEELKRTILGRDKLYSVIAHDLRSPIASIRMVMEVLINGIQKETLDPDMYDLLIMANRLTDDSFTLLDNLLKWTKSQTGRLSTVYQDDVDVMNLVRGVVEVIRGVAKLKNITVNLTGNTSRIARLDIDMAKTALRNLLSNAVKFSYDGSEVEVVIKEEEDRVVVDVIDQGAGINKEKQKLLFKADTHFTSFGTGNEEGSGLGLLLCNEFVKRNGGELWFTSEEGKGSVFSFYIPTPSK